MTDYEPLWEIKDADGDSASLEHDEHMPGLVLLSCLHPESANWVMDEQTAGVYLHPRAARELAHALLTWAEDEEKNHATGP